MKVPADTWKRLLHDKRISHGAFRLMHMLLDHDGRHGCFPGLRCLSREVGSNLTTVSRWLLELKQHDWIKFDAQHRRRTHYQLLPEVVTDGTVTRSGSRLLPEVVTESVTRSGNSTKPRELNQITKGEKPPRTFKRERPEVWKLAKDRERLKKQLAEEKEKSSPDQELMDIYREEIRQITSQFKANSPKPSTTPPPKDRKPSSAQPSTDRAALKPFKAGSELARLFREQCDTAMKSRQ